MNKRNNKKEEKVYPKSARFLLAEDVRREADTNKAILMGVFVGDDIVIRRGKEKTGANMLSSLTLFGLLSGGKGEFAVGARIITPDPNAVKTLPLHPLTIEPGKNAVVIFKMAPFQIVGFGEYTIEITLDEKQTYSYTFQVKEVPTD